jgi:hypothetical protein
MTYTRRPNKFVGTILIFLLLLFAAVLGVAGYRGARHYTYYGPHTDVLPNGIHITVTQDFSALPADQAIIGMETGDKDRLKWGVAPAGDILVRKGSRGIVKLDPAWDDDSCYPERPVAIELSRSNSEAKAVAVPRNLLKP